MADPSADAPLADAEYRALAEFRHSLRRFLAFSERAARDHGLAPAQHQLLLAVRGHEATGSAPDISTLAELLQLRSHSTTELVDRAVGHGLIERVADPDDGRRALVASTEYGRALLEELSRLHRHEVRRFRAEMTGALREFDDS